MWLSYNTRVKSLKIKAALFIVIAAVVLLFSPILSQADVQIGIQDSDINVDTIPDNPQPYDNVTIELSSYATDLTKAMIQWKQGSTLVLSGYGKTSYAFTAPGPDSVTVFTVTIQPVEGGDAITKQIVISPSEIDLMWESANGYTPPFYRGKALPTSESDIRVVAIPNTTTIKQGKGDISYSWSAGQNDTVMTDASGYNKDSFEFQNSAINLTESVSVTASSVDGRYNATNSIDVPIVSPQVIFYKRSPTDGVLYNQALDDSTTITEDEATIVAVPYFLATVGNENNFTYNWQINGSPIDTPAKKTELTIQPTEHDGYATIDVDFENPQTLYQKVTGELNLNF
jgi:hypothetical protein